MTGGKWSIGILGEWVSGLGSLAAVIVAVVVSSRQNRLAQQQFREERDHAVQMANDERRYNESLRRSALKEAEAEQKREEYFRVVHMLQLIAPGIRIALVTMGTIQTNPSYYQVSAQIVLENRHFRLAEQTALSVSPLTFKHQEFANIVGRIGIFWSPIATNFAILANQTAALSESHVKALDINRKNLRNALFECAKSLSRSNPIDQISEVTAEEAANRWVEATFGDTLNS